ncbi:MAG: hypothetical protein HY718_10125 [Planctomycetes bacterium]|nr:hypothetical protein [Planctomycetota bacterium]
MTSRSERAERLLAAMETSHGSGDFVVDPALRVDEVWQGCDAAVGRGVISVLLTDAVDSEEVRRMYHPDRRLIVTTEDPDPSRREVMFEGYPPVQGSGWDGQVGHEGERYVFEAEHVWGRFNRARPAWVYGRRMRSGAIEDGLGADPAAFAASSEHFTALPCIFNPDGEPNRAVEPLRIARPDGTERLIHIFAPEGASAVRWTFASALRYLVWFHLIREGPVFEGNIFDTTDVLAAGEPGEADALREALARECVSLVCEATSLVEALALLASAAGVHTTAETVNAAGQPRTQLRVFSPRGGPLRRLLLVRGGRYEDGVPRYDVSGRTVPAILRDNNTYRGRVTWDHRPIVNHAVVMGDVKRYEVTVPLWPGWRPTENLDNVAAPDRPSSKVLALTPDDVRALGESVVYYDWYRRYHRDGYFYHQYSDVARLWVLNEDGWFDGSYDRNPPFDRYGPFDFAAVLAASETASGRWTRRTRPLEPTLSVGPDGQSLGVWVEVSFDSGVTWYPASGPISVLKDRAGIHFDCDNPTQITPPGVDPVYVNLWYALVDQTFRVRATAVIEGDDRLIATFGPTGLDSPTVQVNTAIIRRPQSFKFASRSVGSSVLYPTLIGGEEERDDSAAAAGLAEWLARTRQDRQVRVAPAIPWIETGYAIGDRITEIAGRCLRFATTVGAETQYPAVTERRFVMREGRYDTVLMLEAVELPENVV